MKSHGYFINLVECIDRRNRIENQLANLKISDIITRFNASKFDHSPINTLTKSEYGCYVSNVRAINESTADINYIFEDDIIFSKDILNWIREPNISIFNDFDVIFFGYGINAFNFDLIKNLINIIKYDEFDLFEEDCNIVKLLDAKYWYQHGCYAYAFNIKSKEKIINNLMGSLNNNLAIPIDLEFKRLFQNGALKGAIIFPSIVSVNQSIPSTMIERQSTPSSSSHIEISNLFVKGGDFDNNLIDLERNARIEMKIQTILNVYKEHLSQN